MLNAIAKPFGLLLMWLYDFTASYGIAVIIFALIVKLILLPFQMKAKRSTMRMSRLQPKVKELEKKHGANKQKYNEAVQKMYREEGVKPMSGCIWSLIPFPILIALYQAIRFPMTIMMGISQDLLNEGGAIYQMLAQRNFSTEMNAAYEQIAQMQFISRPENWPFFANLSDKLQQLDYSFLGLDLGSKPELSVIWNGNWSDPTTLSTALLLLVPIAAGLLTLLQSKISTKLTASGDPNDPQQKTAKMMLYMMPVMTIYFSYIMPAALGVYWIASSVFAIIQEMILNKRYIKIMEREDAENTERQRRREEELEAKRRETEKLKAENATSRNPNTSKKKQLVTEREQQREKLAEWERKNKPAVEENDDPAKIGQRRYARGRAYDPSRYADNGVSTPDPLADALDEPDVSASLKASAATGALIAAEEINYTAEDEADDEYPEESADDEVREDAFEEDESDD